MKLKVLNKGFGSYYSGFIQVIFGSLPCILRTYVVKLLLCKIYTSWLWISCIVLTPMFNFNFSPLRAVVFGIFLILIWALYPAVLSNWTPNHLAELNFSSGEGCEVSQPKIKYSPLLCRVEASQSDHQGHCRAGREAVMFFMFFSIWKLLYRSWIGDICWNLCGQAVVQGTGLCRASTGLTPAGAGEGNWPILPAQSLRHCPPWAGSALHCIIFQQGS